jgi:hypothetical protein
VNIVNRLIGARSEKLNADQMQSCESIVLVGDDIVVQFTFSRDYLGKAHDIEAKMIEVLNRFRISGLPLEVIQ